MLGGNLAVTFLNGYQNSISPSATFTIFTAGNLTGSFANIANGGTFITSDGQGQFKVNYGATSGFSPNSVVLSNFVAVPEPSTWALMLTGGALVLWQA